MSSEFTSPVLPDAPAFGDEPLNMMTRAYLVFLQGLFQQMPAGSWKWSQDEKLSEISITDQAPFPTERLGQRPAIVTMRGPAQFANMTLDNMRTVDWNSGAKERTDIVACTMSLVVLAKFDVEAQKIAWLIARHLRSFKELIQRAGRFHKIGDDLSIDPPTPPTDSVITGEPDSEITMVTVRSPFFFQWTERVTPTDSSLMREIELYMYSALGPPDTTGVRAETVYKKRLTVRGMPIGTADPVGTPIGSPAIMKVR